MRQHVISTAQVIISELLTHCLIHIALERCKFHIITFIHQYVHYVLSWLKHRNKHCSYRSDTILFFFSFFFSFEMFSVVLNSHMKWYLEFHPIFCTRQASLIQVQQAGLIPIHMSASEKDKLFRLASLLTREKTICSQLPTHAPGT